MDNKVISGNGFDGGSSNSNSAGDPGILTRPEKSVLSQKQKRELFADCLKKLNLNYPVDPNESGDTPFEDPSFAADTRNFRLPFGFINLLPLGVMVNDRSGRIIACNEEAKRQLGCPNPARCGDIMKCGQFVSDFVVIDEDHRQITQELRETGMARNKSILIKNCTGEPTPIRASLCNFYDDQNRRQGTINLYLKRMKPQYRILSHILHLTCDLLSIPQSVLWLVNDSDRSKASAELSYGEFRRNYLKQELSLDQPLIRKLRRSEEAITIADAGDEKWKALWDHYVWSLRHDWRTVILVPLVVDKQLVGVWSLHCKDVRQLDDLQLDLIRLFSRHIAAELFRTDLTHHFSVFDQISTLYQELRQAREKLFELFKEVQQQRKRDKSSGDDLEAVFASKDTSIFSKPLILAKAFGDSEVTRMLRNVTHQTKKDIARDLLELGNVTCAEAVALFLADSVKRFKLIKVAEVCLPERHCHFRGNLLKKNGSFFVDEAYGVFDTVFGGEGFVDFSPRQLQKARIELDEIRLVNDGIRHWLKEEGFKVLGDLALMKEEKVRKALDDVPFGFEYLKSLLESHDLGFGMQLFIRDKHDDFFIINKAIWENDFIDLRAFKRLREGLASGKIRHLLQVPIIFLDKKASRKRLLGYVRLLNKVSCKAAHSSSLQLVASGFTDNDLLVLQDRIKIWTPRISDIFSDCTFKEKLRAALRR